MIICRCGMPLLLIASCVALHAQEANPKDDAQSRMRAVLDRSIEWFEFRQPGSDEPLQSLTVLRWTNNARESVDGMTTIWVNAAGRPEAIAAVYPYGEQFCLEFDSLSRTSFQATKDGQLFWAPDNPGLEFASFERVPAPAKSKSVRLLQMKTLARKFNATMLGWTQKSQREELRLLPRPIHRYELGSTADELLDGCLFAFTTGTDPEAVLVLEAVKTETGSEWQYAFARRTSGALEARLEGAIVWEVKAYPPGGQIGGTYRGHRQPLAPLLDAVVD